MQEIIQKYIHKLQDADLIEPGHALLGFLDADLVWNRQDPKNELLEKIFNGININSLLFAPPKEPYRSIIDYLTRTEGRTISPQDCETRTFIHDIPVVSRLDPDLLLHALKTRKAVIVKDKGILTYGWVSPEQTYINYSSVCFACFVKFFSDYLRDYKLGRDDPGQREIIANALSRLDPLPDNEKVKLKQGPFRDKGEVVLAMDEAGKKVVQYKLVDSFFGNISYLLEDCLYISQTSSSLDELTGHIDPCPLDNSTSAGITASSELSAHRDILKKTGHLAVLHGHPKFAVIMSMDCDKKASCDQAGECHRRCREDRQVCGFPIVPGEVGSGPFGLCRTVPPAIEKDKGVIVYGHGVFTTGAKDFNQALKGLMEIEKTCLQEYKRRVELK
ncbi:MAG: class II aldolase/adducin family protein [Thermodesulfobacteriota bacterium]